MGVWVAAVNQSKDNRWPWKTVHQNNRRSYIHNHSAAPNVVLPATRHRFNNEGYPRDTLMISPLLIRLLHGNSDVILFDCTYKTNRYNRPVLNISVTTGLNTTIHAGVVLMCEGKESDY
jgi:hypothetical protein